MGTPHDDITKGLRAHPVRSHVFFYREKANVLEVVRILHESMDPQRHVSPGRSR